MQVRCKINRPGGTTITFDEHTYHFAANERGDHVCTVSDPAALSKLINEVSEGYELYGTDANKTVQPVAPPAKTVHPLKKPDGEPDLIIEDENGKRVDLRSMDIEDLRAFAAKEFGVVVNAKAKPEQIHAKIIEAMRAAQD